MYQTSEEGSAGAAALQCVSQRLLLTFALRFHNCETNLIAVSEKLQRVTVTTVHLCQSVLQPLTFLLTTFKDNTKQHY